MLTSFLLWLVGVFISLTFLFLRLGLRLVNPQLYAAVKWVLTPLHWVIRSLVWLFGLIFSFAALTVFVIMVLLISSVVVTMDNSLIENKYGADKPKTAASAQQLNSPGGVPPVSLTPKDIPDSLVRNAAWAMSTTPSAGCGQWSYVFGGNGPCGIDCSSFILMILQMSGWSMEGGGKLTKLEGDRFVAGKAPVRGSGVRSSGQMVAWSRGNGTYKGEFSGNFSQLKPGDILSNPTHVFLYVGNVNGREMIVHASFKGAKQVTKDAQMTQPTTDVGYEAFPSMFHKGFSIIRLSDYNG